MRNIPIFVCYLHLSHDSECSQKENTCMLIHLFMQTRTSIFYHFCPFCNSKWWLGRYLQFYLGSRSRIFPVCWCEFLFWAVIAVAVEPRVHVKHFCVVSLESNHLNLAFKLTVVSSSWQALTIFFLWNQSLPTHLSFSCLTLYPPPPSWVLGPPTSFYLPSSCSLSLPTAAFLAGAAFHEGTPQWYHIAVPICLKLAERWCFGS